MFARLIDPDGSVVVEQIDFTPAAGQVVIVPGAGWYRVVEKPPTVQHISPGGGLPAKWMNVVEVAAVKEG